MSSNKRFDDLINSINEVIEDAQQEADYADPDFVEFSRYENMRKAFNDSFNDNLALRERVKKLESELLDHNSLKDSPTGRIKKEYIPPIYNIYNNTTAPWTMPLCSVSNVSNHVVENDVTTNQAVFEELNKLEEEAKHEGCLSKIQKLSATLNNALYERDRLRADHVKLNAALQNEIRDHNGLKREVDDLKEEIKGKDTYLAEVKRLGKVLQDVVEERDNLREEVEDLKINEEPIWGDRLCNRILKIPVIQNNKVKKLIFKCHLKKGHTIVCSYHKEGEVT